MTRRPGLRYGTACGLWLAALISPAAVSAQQSKHQSGQDAPPAVMVATVKDEEVTKSTRFVGRVQAIQQTELKARVEGFLESVEFREGALVKTGQQLYQIETGPYEAALAGAQASLAVGQATQARTQAALNEADLTLGRQKTLLKSEAVAQAVVDRSQATRDEAYAQLQAANAQIAEAKAQIETAQLNLSYTKVNSPIDGRIGKTNYTKGNLVNPQSGTLATVVQMDPMRVVFSIADRDYVDVIEKDEGTPNVNLKKEFVPTLLLPNGKTYDQKGKISFIDNKVDPQTGTIAVYADFANAHFELVRASSSPSPSRSASRRSCR
jgi:membrane fusion protein (multidrug efflux system)